MKRFVVGGIVVIVVVAAVILVMRGRAERAAPPPPIPVVQGPERVEAEGRVIPRRSVTLAFTGGGTIAELLVAVGDQVAAGQLLVRTESAREVAAAVAQSQAALTRARARLAEVAAGAREAEIESARSALSAAEARYAALRAGARPQERAQARHQVEQAEARFVAAGTRVAQAETALRLAEGEERRMAQLLGEGAVAEQDIQRARARVQTARGDLEAARAESGAAEAQLAAARQHLALVAAGPRPEDLEIAAAEVRGARAQLALVQAGPRPESVAAARADVAAAEAALAQATAALARTELRAPFPGVVGYIGPAVGEFVAPGEPVVRIGDTATWEIETTDLTELSVPRVRPGDPAAVRLDAFPNLELTGRVVAVEPFGENRQGDITYRVRIALDRQDARLRWNMTAAVTIEQRAAGDPATPEIPVPGER